MFRHVALATALAATLAAPLHASAMDDAELSQIRVEIKQLKEAYESRIQALEQRLQAAESRPAAPARSAAAAASPANAFNPAVSLTLGGTYANLKRDPAQYRIQGFIPGGDESGPGKRSFNLGESELSLSANVDPHFSGKLTFALNADNQASVEEAHFETLGLANGLNLKGGRFLSSIGYLNGQHAHAWDFVDAPLVYKAMFGGQYKQDGLQLRWLAPTERFLELGIEAGNGNAFPGNDRSKNGIGAVTIFGHVGDDIGDSASWRAGVSLLRTASAARNFSDIDHTGTGVTDAFAGDTHLWAVDGIYKWSPNGNSTRINFKLQGEYFRRKENGTLTYDTQAQSLGTTLLRYGGAQSGGYVQGVFQYAPNWRVGLRLDKLNAVAPSLALAGTALTSADFRQLLPYAPTRSSLMFDFSPSEFSRIRLQFAQDKARPGVTDNQVFLQYIMSLGAHGAHSF